MYAHVTTITCMYVQNCTQLRIRTCNANIPVDTVKDVLHTSPNGDLTQ